MRGRWIAAAAALLLAFMLGFLIGRAGGDGDTEQGTGGGSRWACERAATLAVRVVRIHRQALANRVAFAEAVARGDEGDMRELDEALASINQRGERVFPRSERAAQRCFG